MFTDKIIIYITHAILNNNAYCKKNYDINIILYNDSYCSYTSYDT